MIGVRLSPLVRRVLSGSELFEHPERETHNAALELRAAVIYSKPTALVELSPAAAEILADYVDVALYAATDDGTSAERAAYRRTLGQLAEQGVWPV